MGNVQCSEITSKLGTEREIKVVFSLGSREIAVSSETPAIIALDVKYIHLLVDDLIVRSTRLM